MNNRARAVSVACVMMMKLLIMRKKGVYVFVKINCEGVFAKLVYV